MGGEISISYLGWSGFRIDRQDGVPIFIDPDARAELPLGRPLVILLTHGHPEHLGGTRAYLERAGNGADATIFASTAICRHLARRSKAGRLKFKPVCPGMRLEADGGVSITVFQWQHLPLLPYGFGPAVRHVAQLLSNPQLALRIAWAGLTGPRPGPMLGFQIGFGDGDVVAYGEGLHRFCKPRRGDGPQDRTILLAGIEPGDESAVPDLIRECGVRSAILYEPHAKWRDAFRMPQADLASVRDSLMSLAVSATIARQGCPILFRSKASSTSLAVAGSRRHPP